MYNRVGRPVEVAGPRFVHAYHIAIINAELQDWRNHMKPDDLNKPNTQTIEPKEVKSKILSRIQQQLNRKEGEESMTHTKHDQHNKVNQYLKGPINPIAE